MKPKIPIKNNNNDRFIVYVFVIFLWVPVIIVFFIIFLFGGIFYKLNIKKIGRELELLSK